MAERSERYSELERKAAMAAAKAALPQLGANGAAHLVATIFASIGMKPASTGETDDRDWQPAFTMPRGVDYDVDLRLTNPVREVRATWWNNWEDPAEAPRYRWCWREASAGSGWVGDPIEQTSVQWWKRA